MKWFINTFVPGLIVYSILFVIFLLVIGVLVHFLILVWRDVFAMIG